MNEIIGSLLDWCYKNKFCVNINVRGDVGTIWVTLRLQRGRYVVNKLFYVVGGPSCKEDWERRLYDKELEQFLEKAKREFGEVGESE